MSRSVCYTLRTLSISDIHTFVYTNTPSTSTSLSFSLKLSHTRRLDALDPNAYAAFQASHDLRDMVDRVVGGGEEVGKPGMKKSLSIRATLMTPVKPMLVGFT